VDNVDPSIILGQIAYVQSLSVAIIGGIFGVIMKWQERRRERERKDDLEYREKREREEAEYKADRDAKEKARKEFDTAQLNLVFAVSNGLLVLLHAAHGDQVNGNVDAAIASIQKAKGECNMLTNENAIDNLS